MPVGLGNSGLPLGLATQFVSKGIDLNIPPLLGSNTPLPGVREERDAVEFPRVQPGKANFAPFLDSFAVFLHQTWELGELNPL